MVERGERLGGHYAVCPQCKAAYAQYQRIVAAMAFVDEAEERGSFAEERLLAKIQEKPARRWPKLVPLSAFFGFLSLGRRAAAAPTRTAICAVAAMALIGPLPLLIEGVADARSGRATPSIVASGISSRPPDTPEFIMSSRSEGLATRGARGSAGARGANLSLELRKKEEPARVGRLGMTAAARPVALPQREAPAASKSEKRQCPRAKKCPNVVLEMVVNGLTGYVSGAKGRRANARM